MRIPPAVPLVWALFTWLCTLPLLILFVLPRLGVQVTATAALALLVAALLACCWICRERPLPGDCDAR